MTASSEDITKVIQDTSGVNFYLLYFVLIFAPTFSLIVSSLTISIQNWGATCGGSMMSLSTWLLVFAIFKILYLVKSAVAAFCRREENGAKVFYYGAFVHILVIFIWNIVGAVALFRDSYDCMTEAHSLWIMTLSVLLIEWIIAFIFICTCGLCFCTGCCMPFVTKIGYGK